MHITCNVKPSVLDFTAMQHHIVPRGRHGAVRRQCILQQQQQQQHRSTYSVPTYLPIGAGPVYTSCPGSSVSIQRRRCGSNLLQRSAPCSTSDLVRRTAGRDTGPPAAVQSTRTADTASVRQRACMPPFTVVVVSSLHVC